VARWNDIERAVPEYDDCKRAAEVSGAALLTVMQAAREAWSNTQSVKRNAPGGV
jgi:uncharacterized protein (DUF111 family)